MCSCVEFDFKNVLYKSNSYVSVTVIFTNKSTTAILASMQRSTHVHFLWTTSAGGELSCGISSCLILYSISISSDLAVRVVTCHWHLDRVSLMSNSCLISTLISLWGILLLNCLFLTDFWVLNTWGSNCCYLSCTYNFPHLIWKYLVLTFIDGNLQFGGVQSVFFWGGKCMLYFSWEWFCFEIVLVFSVSIF